MSSPYSNYKLAFFPNKLENLQYGKEVVHPITVQIDLTNKCNAACGFCVNRDLRKSDNFRASWQVDIGKAMMCITESGCRGVHISGGGEPLLHPDVEWMCSTLSSRKIPFGIDTNGFLPDHPALQYAEWIRVSLNAASYVVHKKITGIPDKFDTVAQGMRNLSSKGKFVTANFVVCPENIDDIHGAAWLAKEAGIKGIRYSFAVTEKGKSLFEPEKEKMIRLLCLAEVMNQEKFSVGVAWDQLNNMDQPQSAKTFKHCHYAKLVCVIGANGLLYPCCDLKYLEPNFGNILDEGFSNVWFGMRRKNWLNAMKPQECVVRCDVDAKNHVLTNLIEEPMHKEFI